MEEKNQISLEQLIEEETTCRLEEMASPDYEFPERINRWDVLWMILSAAISAVLIVLCMTGVIS